MNSRKLAKLMFLSSSALLGTYAFQTLKKPVLKIENPSDPVSRDKIKAMRAAWPTKPETVIHENDEKAYEKIVARAKELQETYKDTHAVFFHGFPTEGIVVLDVLNKQATAAGIHKPHMFNYVRKPRRESLTERYKQKVLRDLCVRAVKAGKSDDHTVMARQNMMSVDAYLPKPEEIEQVAFKGESAGSFLKHNVSTSDFDMKQVLQSIVPDPALCDELESLGKSLREEVTCGNLLVICIPKHLLSDPETLASIGYHSHPGGIACNCHPGKDLERLQDLQQGHLTASTKCRSGSMPQFRLLTDALIAPEENGVLVIAVTPFEKEKRKEIKTGVESKLNQQKKKEESTQVVSSRGTYR